MTSEDTPTRRKKKRSASLRAQMCAYSVRAKTLHQMTSLWWRTDVQEICHTCSYFSIYWTESVWFFLGDTPDVSVSEFLPSPQAHQPPTRGRGRKTCGGVSSTARCRKRGWRKRCSRMQRLSDLNHLWHFQVLMMSKTKKTQVKVYKRNAVKWGEPWA